MHRYGWNTEKEQSHWVLHDLMECEQRVCMQRTSGSALEGITIVCTDLNSLAETAAWWNSARRSFGTHRGKQSAQEVTQMLRAVVVD